MSTRRPVILGGGAVAFGRYRDASNWRDWVRRAGREALADAGIVAAQVDSLVVASESDFFSLQLAPGGVVADELGLGGVAVTRMDGADNLSFARLLETRQPPQAGDRVRLTPVSGPVPHPAQAAVFTVIAGDDPDASTRAGP